MKKWNIIGKRTFFLSFSGLLVLAGIAAILLLGFRQGIDFVGGALWQMKFADKPDISEQEVRGVFADLGVSETVINKDIDTQSFLIRLKDISEIDHQRYLKALKTKFGAVEELQFQSIGPSIGYGLRRDAFVAVLLVMIGISIYIAFAFRKVSYPVSSWKYGLITLITLFHDVAIPAGLFALLGRLRGVEVDTNFIVALLVVMGFSVHDTIVVFDRIRENLLLHRRDTDLATIVNDSVNETFARSVNTSLTLIFVLLAMYFLGPVSLRYFILTILVGTVAGTYSSIFVASPLLVVWHKFRK